MLPKSLKNFNVIIDGRPMAGLAEEVVLPALERKTEEYRAGGMRGAVELDLGLEKMKLEFTLGEFNTSVLSSWGVYDAGGINTRFLGAARSDDASTVQAIEISVRGRWKKIDQGTVKGGDGAKMKVEMPLTYFKYTVDGKVLIEIDMVNGTEVVNGTDRTADERKALGL